VIAVSIVIVSRCGTGVCFRHSRMLTTRSRLHDPPLFPFLLFYVCVSTTNDSITRARLLAECTTRRQNYEHQLQGRRKKTEGLPRAACPPRASATSEAKEPGLLFTMCIRFGTAIGMNPQFDFFSSCHCQRYFSAGLPFARKLTATPPGRGIRLDFLLDDST
jgi:hypothetical protein